jgi:hypothetical protein
MTATSGNNSHLFRKFKKVSFSSGLLFEDSLHLAKNSIFGNLESLIFWPKQFFEHLKVVGAFDGAVKDVKLKNSIDGSCEPHQKCLIMKRHPYAVFLS